MIQTGRQCIPVSQRRVLPSSLSFRVQSFYTQTLAWYRHSLDRVSRRDSRGHLLVNITNASLELPRTPCRAYAEALPGSPPTPPPRATSEPDHKRAKRFVLPRSVARHTPPEPISSRRTPKRTPSYLARRLSRAHTNPC